MRLLATFALFASILLGQVQFRTVTLSWNDTKNPPTTTTYAVYQASGSCTQSSPAFVKVVGGVTVKTYSHTGVAPGVYCYTVRAEAGGLESGNSNLAQADAPPFTVDNVQVVVTVTVTVTTAPKP